MIDTPEIVQTGPQLTAVIHLTVPRAEIEICLPVAAPVKPLDRLHPGLLPAATAARTVYHGNYERLGAAWAEFRAWIRSRLKP